MKYFKLLSLVTILSFTFSCNNEPLEGDFPNQSDASCINATQATVTAATNFSDATDENFSDLCMAYVTALENQITACGDTNGALQQVIDNLACSDGPGNGDASFVGEWEAIAFTADVTSASNVMGVDNEIEINVEGFNLNYNLTFTETSYTTDGGYDINAEVTVNGMSNGTQSDSYTQIMGSGNYTTNGNVITVDGSFFEFEFNGVDTSALNGEQSANFAFTNNGDTVTFTQNETMVDNSGPFPVTITVVSSSVWNRVQ